MCLCVCLSQDTHKAGIVASTDAVDMPTEAPLSRRRADEHSHLSLKHDRVLKIAAYLGICHAGHL